MDSLHIYLLTILMICSFYTDVRERRIPNWLTLSVTVFALVSHVAMNGWTGLLFSICGGMIAFGIFFILYLFRAIGAGDVKLFGAIGACMGIEFTLYSMMYSILYAGIIGVLILIVRQQLAQRLLYIFYYFIGILVRRDLASFKYPKSREVLTFPFMYAVFPGVTTTGYYYFF